VTDFLLRKVLLAPGIVGAALVSACNAHAEPPAFPDMSGYAQVDPKDYGVQSENPGRPYPLTLTFFLTPDGVLCDFLASQAQCMGNNFPGLPPAPPSSNGAARVNWIGTVSGLQTSPAASEPLRDGVKTLPPRHSISVDGAVCGVDDEGTTACKDSQGRGFVLSPHGSGWLKHV
jgi:hypothetical protein